MTDIYLVSIAYSDSHNNINAIAFVIEANDTATPDEIGEQGKVILLETYDAIEVYSVTVETMSRGTMRAIVRNLVTKGHIQVTGEI
jgi:hypothetical protein